MANKQSYSELVAKNYDPKNPNACLAEVLEKFDYEKLVDKKHEEYNELIDELCPPLGIGEGTRRQFDWVVLKAEPIMKDRYPGLPNTPRDFVGIKLITGADGQKMAPIHPGTRMEMKHAVEMNKQLINTRRIYLLKKI